MCGRVQGTSRAGRPGPPERSKPKLLDLNEGVGDGGRGDAATRGRGDAAGRGWGIRVVFWGWGRDSCRVSVVPCDSVVKDQGGRWLTAIGSGGGAEDRMVYRGGRPYAPLGGGRGRSG